MKRADKSRRRAIRKRMNAEEEQKKSMRGHNE